ncbi:MAG: TonB-dependent receptor [Gemmatimonadaceae bacterium]
MRTFIRLSSIARTSVTLAVASSFGVQAAIVGAAAVVVSGASTTVAGAQAATPTGRITGRVIDAASGQGVSDAQVQIVGTTMGAQSGIDGRFNLLKVPAGTVTLQVRRIGYAAKTVTGLLLDANGVLEQDVTMSIATPQLQSVSVTATLERGSVNSALDNQRTGTGITNSVTAEQIAKSPDKDAAQAVQRVSGVTVQDGKYVFVRGLGERYTTTSLNGARVPSPEPDRKVVPLDMFPSALLQTITTSKTFTPDQSGDFSGAQVDITTREFPAKRLITFSSSVGYNSAVTSRDVISGARLGTEWLGFSGSGRAIPSIVDGLTSRTLSPALSTQYLSTIHNNWTPFNTTGIPNSSYGASIGGQTAILNHSFGYVGSLSYQYTQESRRNELRQLVVGGGTAQVRAYNSYEGTTGRESVLWGGIANFSTLVGSHTRVAFNNMYNRSADNEAHLDAGFDEGQTNDPTARISSVKRSWLDFVERTVRSDQLKIEHTFGSNQSLDFAVTSAGVTRGEPDRTDLFSRRDKPTDQYILALGDTKGARRFYSTLNESNITPSLNYSKSFGETAAWKLKIGSQLRSTDRDATSQAFYFSSNAATADELRQAPELIFPMLAARTNGVTLNVDPTAGTYTAHDQVFATYAMLQVPLASRLELVGGARLENWKLNLNTRQYTGDQFDSTYKNNDVLPSLALNVRLSERQNIRFSASRTLSRPEYRELSLLQDRGPIGDLDFVGNPKLKRALITNFDARWELYPNPGEILSVALFGKNFANPIERVQISTNGGNIYSFVNADGANNYGIELEARKNLGFIAIPFRSLSGFSNVTLMKSKITPGNTDISALTSADRPMVGQAPYVVNAGLSYSNLSGRASATVLYNVVGRTITTTGTKPTPDTYREARNGLDLSLQFPLLNVLSAKINARNLLDAPYKETAGGVTRISYRTGRTLSVGFGWTPGATP